MGSLYTEGMPQTRGDCVGSRAVNCEDAIKAYCEVGVAVGGTGVEVAGNFTDGHAILVHARPAFKHLH